MVEAIVFALVTSLAGVAADKIKDHKGNSHAVSVSVLNKSN